MKTNLTISVDTELAESFRAYVRANGQTMAQFVSERIEEVLGEGNGSLARPRRNPSAPPARGTLTISLDEDPLDERVMGVVLRCTEYEPSTAEEIADHLEVEAGDVEEVLSRETRTGALSRRVREPEGAWEYWRAT